MTAPRREAWASDAGGQRAACPCVGWRVPPARCSRPPAVARDERERTRHRESHKKLYRHIRFYTTGRHNRGMPKVHSIHPGANLLAHVAQLSAPDTTMTAPT